MTNETATVSSRVAIDDAPASVAAAARRALESPGGPAGIAVAAAPTVVFVVANVLGGLGRALAALTVTAPVAFGGAAPVRRQHQGAFFICRRQRSRSPTDGA
jgi:precorrin isomerase